MSQRGFTLIELLVACLLVMAVTGAVASLAVPTRDAFERTLSAADLSGGSRAVLERLVLDIREAGSGAAVGLGPLGLADVAAILVPLADIGGSVAVPARALKVTRIGLGAPQGVLRQALAAGTTSLELETAVRCARIGPACGLEPGLTAVIFDSSRAVTFTVGSVGVGVVQSTSALSAGFNVGAVVASTTVTTYGLRTNADLSRSLVRVSPGGAEQPVLQNVVDFEVLLRGETVGPRMDVVAGAWPSYGPSPPLVDVDDPRDTWGAGENCTTTRDDEGLAVTRLEALSATPDLVPMTTTMLTDGPWCADASDSTRFDADLLRVRAIEIKLRVEAASAILRGPAGQLFRRSGTQPNAARWVPDVELRLIVGLRNATH